MTDKQIIIDGVDVSECKYWKGYCRIASLCDYSGHLCEVTPKCYYKQLKAKEQECEELKEEIDDLKEIIQRHDNDNNALLSEFEDDLVDYYRRYKECLAEIKEICNSVKNIENINSLYDAKLSGMFLQANKILQKISEVENEN